jgi:hypothetical protein
MKLQLTKTQAAGETVYRAANPSHAVFVQHLTGGMPSFGDSFVDSFKALAKAHGWQVTLKKAKDEAVTDFFEEAQGPDPRFKQVIAAWCVHFEEIFREQPVLQQGKDHGTVKRFLKANPSLTMESIAKVFVNIFQLRKADELKGWLFENAVSLSAVLNYFDRYRMLPQYREKPTVVYI